MLTLTLPLPPSVNRLWRAGRRRAFRSKSYEAWRTEAGWQLKVQKPATCRARSRSHLPPADPASRSR